MYRRTNLILLLVISIANLTILVPQVRPAGAQGGPDPRFGTIEAFWAPNEAAELNVGWERILFYWNELQPTGPNDWNTLHVREEWLAEAQANNRKVLGLLKNTPTWATDDIPFAGVPRGLELPIDDPNNLWANFVRQTVSYYSPRGVHNWIIWNEPDISAGTYGHEFSGTVQDYYRLLKVAYQVIKSVDPNATVHLAGLTWWHDQGYLRRFLEVATADPEAAANNYFFDALSLHIYFRVETVQSIVGAVWGVQNQFGLRKPVWIIETNASPNLDPLWPVNRPQFQIDLEQQAWYVVQAHALGFAAGASHIGVYKLIDIQLPPGGESFGVLRPDYSRRPAFDAYRTTIQYLRGFSRVQRQQEANYFIVTFTRPVGVTRVLWARTAADVPLRVPALAESATLVDALGQTQEIAAVNGAYDLTLAGARCRGECLVGGAPFFLVEAGVVPESIPTAPPPLPVTATPTGTLSITPTAVITETVTPTPSPSPSPTASPTASRTPRPTATATATKTPTATPTETATATATPVTPTPSATAEPVALVPSPTVDPTEPAPVVEGSSSVGQRSGLWLLGAAGLLAGLMVVMVRRKR